METRRRREHAARRDLARRTVDFLCGAPGSSNTTVTTATFRAMLLESDGYVTYNGKRYEIKGKSLGAGVYRVKLEEG